MEAVAQRSLKSNVFSLMIATGVAGVVALGLLALTSPVELAAQAPAAVLPLPNANLAELPLRAQVGRDASLTDSIPKDAAAAARLADELKAARADFAHAQGPRALELHQQAYRGWAAIAYYLEDALAGRLGLTIDAGKTQNQLQAVRQLVVQHATAAAKLAAGHDLQDALLHVYTARLASGESAVAIAGLKDLASAKLDTSMRRQVLALLAMHGVNASGGKAGAHVLPDANAVMNAEAGHLAPMAQIAVRLSLARSLAGLNSHGHKVAAPQPAYRGQLAAVAAKAKGLNAADRSAVLAAMIGIWRAAGDQSGMDWHKPPFNLGPYADELATKAVLERAALADWAAGRKAQARHKLDALAASMNGSPYRADLDLRRLSLEAQEYETTKNPALYAASLLATSKVYVDASVLGDGATAKAKNMAQEVTRRHLALVQKEAGLGEHPGASAAQRRRALALASGLAATLPDAATMKIINTHQANLHALVGEHAQAVDLYRQLATGSKDQNEQRRFYALAIRSQSVLASWTEAAPWGGAKAGDADAREALKALYLQLATVSGGKSDWFVAAQVGLLDMALDHRDAAFTLWQAQLQKDAAGAHAAHAAGAMLVAYKQDGNWAALEKLARFCLAKHVAAVHRGGMLASVDLLGLALLEGGKQYLSRNEYAAAVRKFEEFVRDHGKQPNHDEGFYLLAVAYRGNRQHEVAVQTLQTFADRYPASKYQRAALLNGSDWSAAMAFEENVMFFANRFLTRFAQDSETPRVRSELVALYLGRGRYADAVATLNHATRYGTSEQATEALTRILDIEERHGSAARAAMAADSLLRRPDASEEAICAAYSLKTRLAAGRGAGAGAALRQIEARLRTMHSDAAQDALGEVRYVMAYGMSKAAIQDTFNLALTDPTATLKQRYAVFSQARAALKAVCDAGNTSYCAPAMARLSQLSLDFMKSIEDISIQETLAASTVAQFRSLKQSIMNDGAATSQAADTMAMQAVRQGHTDPDWTQAVLWQNTADWNFDRVSGEAGGGFVQWSAE